MQKLLADLVLVGLLFFISTSEVYAQIVINEFSSGSSDDWVELYNTSTASAELSGYRLRDSTANNKKDLTGTINGGSYISFDFSNYLNNAGDIVKLIKIEGEIETIIESISYGDQGGICAPSDSQSIGRNPDGNGQFARLVSSTRDAPNTTNQAPCVSPSPTPEPTPDPTPNVNPSPQSSPTITSTSKPSSSPKKATPKPSETEEIEETPEAQVLGTSFESSPSSSPSPTETKQPKPFPVGIIFVIAGILFSGAGGYLAYKKHLLPN